MSKEKTKKNRPKEYRGDKRFKEYVKDLETPPYPGWKPQSYEWLEPEAMDKLFWSYTPCVWEKRVIDSSEACMYEVEVKVQEILGTGVCPYGHKAGDTFIFEGDGHRTVKSSAPCGGLCMRAYQRIQPSIGWAMMGSGDMDYGRGEQHNWMQITICPEVENPVVFQLKRVKKKEPYSTPAVWNDVVKKKHIEYMKE
jgi:uncharacterized repeat protein (TIGR04076 family)